MSVKCILIRKDASITTIAMPRVLPIIEEPIYEVFKYGILDPEPPEIKTRKFGLIANSPDKTLAIYFEESS